MYLAEEFILYCLFLSAITWASGPVVSWEDWEDGPSYTRGLSHVNPLGEVKLGSPGMPINVASSKKAGSVSYLLPSFLSLIKSESFCSLSLLISSYLG